MTDPFVILPMVLPIFVGFLLVPLRNYIRVQRWFTATTMVAVLGLVIYQTAWIRQHGMLVYQAGNWPAPFGITLAVDLFPALLMIMTMVTGIACLFYAFRSLSQDKERFFFYPLYLLITGSINGAFMTGDLFNLFVFFELILMAAYLLLTIGGGPIQLRESYKFMLINVVSASFFLIGVGLLYSVTGTLNMADLALKVAAVESKGIIAAIAVVFLFSFGIKSALVPLFFWLPHTYAAALTPVTAFLGEVGTKVGVYALYRIFTLIFIHHIAFTHTTLIMWLAVITMVVGVLGAIAQMDFKRLLAFHIVSQIGYMIFGLSLMSIAGLAGGMIHIVHHMAAKPALFLLAGATEESTGTTHLGRMQGLIHHAPALAFAFFLGGLSLTGVPPMSGFFSKFFLFQAGFGQGYWLPTTAAVVVSLLTLFSMMKIFRLVYWGRPDALTPEQKHGMPRYRRFLAPGAALVGVGLVMGLGAHWLIDLTQTSAAMLLDPNIYVEAVLGPDAAVMPVLTGGIQ